MYTKKLFLLSFENFINNGFIFLHGPHHFAENKITVRILRLSSRISSRSSSFKT